MNSLADWLDLEKLSRPQRYARVAGLGATVTLGTIGYFQYSAEHAQPVTIWSALYHTMQLFVLHAPHFEGHINWMLEIARWVAPVLSGSVAYTLAKGVLKRESARWKLQRTHDHVVICGLGRKSVDCVKFERSRPLATRKNVVVIDRAPPADLAKLCEEKGAMIISGDVMDPAILESAGVARASSLYALCPEDDTNCEVAVQTRALLERSAPRHKPLYCNVHISDLELRGSLQVLAPDAVGDARMTVRFFDLFDVEARRLLLTDLPIDHDGVGVGEPRRVHLVILGFGRMGRAIAERAAKLGHFANATTDPRRRLRISVIDRKAREQESILLYRHPQFRSCCDLEVYEDEIESVASQVRVTGWCADPDSICSIVVGVDNEARAAAIAMKLLPGVAKTGTRIALRLAHRTGLASVIERARVSGLAPELVRIYGMIDDGCCNTVFDTSADEQLAQRIHEEFVRGEKPRRPHDDEAMKPWRDLLEVFRESNRQQADHIAIKLRAIGCEVVSQDDPRPAVTKFEEPAKGRGGEVEVMAMMEHERWNAERWMDGWTYAPGKKDPKARTSPSLVPWKDLHDDTQEFDRKAVRFIPELLASVGKKASRR